MITFVKKTIGKRSYYSKLLGKFIHKKLQKLRFQFE